MFYYTYILYSPLAGFLANKNREDNNRGMRSGFRKVRDYLWKITRRVLLIFLLLLSAIHYYFVEDEGKKEVKNSRFVTFLGYCYAVLDSERFEEWLKEQYPGKRRIVN